MGDTELRLSELRSGHILRTAAPGRSPLVKARRIGAVLRFGSAGGRSPVELRGEDGFLMAPMREHRPRAAAQRAVVLRCHKVGCLNAVDRRRSRNSSGRCRRSARCSRKPKRTSWRSTDSLGALPQAALDKSARAVQPRDRPPHRRRRDLPRRRLTDPARLGASDRGRRRMARRTGLHRPAIDRAAPRGGSIDPTSRRCPNSNRPETPTTSPTRTAPAPMPYTTSRDLTVLDIKGTRVAEFIGSFTSAAARSLAKTPTWRPSVSIPSVSATEWGSRGWYHANATRALACTDCGTGSISSAIALSLSIKRSSDSLWASLRPTRPDSTSCRAANLPL
jgi:hypothetical protein